MRTINSNSAFNELVASGKPFVLDFYADWCGPCQRLLPTVEKLAAEYEEDVIIAKVNVDSQQELAAKFKVRSIPSIFFLTSNEVKDKVNGLVSEPVLRKKIEALLN